MSLPLYQVDAFTSSPFSGNPAAVCLLSAPKSDVWMQSLAAEMNLSETAFLLEREDGYDLRWFTLTVEVDLCGHATLAAAHVLWESRRLTIDQPARFRTRSGLLIAVRRGDRIEMDFPAEPAEPCEPPEALTAGLGVPFRFVGKNRFDYLVEVQPDTVVSYLAPDFKRLAELKTRGVIVTSTSSSEKWDFVSRFFAPGAGIDEDPVTGSAHCCLAPFWASRLGKEEMVGFQLSARRGTVYVRLRGDRVMLGGHAATIFRGELDEDAAAFSGGMESDSGLNPFPGGAR